jgi:alpha-L-fucosidase
VIQMNEDKVLNFISLGEYIRLGQRIRAFEVDIKDKGNWVTVAHGTTIGYKRILALNGCITRAIRIRIMDAKACPIIHTIEVF